MSASPDDNYEELVDKLRELQAKLYKEAAFEEYRKNEENILSTQLENSFKKAYFCQKYYIYLNQRQRTCRVII